MTTTNSEDTYLKLLRKTFLNGEERQDRTGTGTYSIFGKSMSFNLKEGFPLLTTKKMFTKAIIHELLWFISGSSNIKYLQDNGVTIWDEWAKEDGELGPVYGTRWRNWSGIDQLAELIEGLQTNPTSRRHIISAWDVPRIKDMALPPCHLLFQCYVTNSGKLDLQVYQRSCDIFLGVPFNIASYALLAHMIAQVTDLRPGTLHWVGGDVHLYKNHLIQAREQITRIPYPAPIVYLNPQIKDINKFTFEDIQILHYNYHPGIKAEISV